MAQTRAKEIYDDILALVDGDKKRALVALEDGQALAELGYTNEDQEAIDLAYCFLLDMVKTEGDQAC